MGPYRSHWLSDLLELRSKIAITPTARLRYEDVSNFSLRRSQRISFRLRSFSCAQSSCSCISGCLGQNRIGRTPLGRNRFCSHIPVAAFFWSAFWKSALANTDAAGETGTRDNLSLSRRPQSYPETTLRPRLCAINLSPDRSPEAISLHLCSSLAKVSGSAWDIKKILADHTFFSHNTPCAVRWRLASEPFCIFRR